MISKPVPEYLKKLSLSYLQRGEAELDINSVLSELNHKESIEYLSDNIVCDYYIECFLTMLRKHLLLTIVATDSSILVQNLTIDSLSAVSLQCFNTEYIYFISKEEYEHISRLKESLYGENLSGSLIHLLIYSCYCSLYEDKRIREMVLQQTLAVEPITKVVKRQLHDIRLEETIRNTIPSIGHEKHGVSLSVQEHYEQHPYPRWVDFERPSACTLDDYCRQRLVQLESINSLTNIPENILVAGCGTGILAIQHAYRFPSSRIIAIDLSLSSLSYAQRVTDELNIKSIEYIQADIRDISQMGLKFDLIECIGVLSHTEDPYMHCRIMVEYLARHGAIRASLYSYTARQQLQACSKQLADKGFIVSADNIRNLRREFMNEPELSNHKSLIELDDYYSITGLFDMLFHTYERHYQLEEITLMIDKLNLNFIGLEFATQDNYLSDDDTTMTLDALKNIEQHHPDLFFPHYIFWMMKKVI